MGHGHQLVGVWPEGPTSAKISSEESACFSAKICTSENFSLYGMFSSSYYDIRTLPFSTNLCVLGARICFNCSFKIVLTAAEARAQV